MTPYATEAHFALVGLPAPSTQGVSSESITEALAQASSKINSYIGGRYTLPLSAFGPDLRRCAIVIAAYDLMTFRGYKPQTETDNFRLRYLDEIKWLEGVRDGEINPEGVKDSTPADTTDDGDASVVCSDAPRGW